LNRLLSKILHLNLYTPTHFTKINDLLIIVDCWNNRILYLSKFLFLFRKWKNVTIFNKPHRIRFYKDRYYVCDTDNHRIVSLDQNMHFCESLEIIELERPHDIQIHKDNLYIVDCYRGFSRVIQYNLLTSNIEILYMIKGVYVRSLKIIDNNIFLSCSSSGEIIKIELDNNHLITHYCENQDKLNLPCINQHEQLIYGEKRLVPNDIDFFNGYFYMTNYFYENTKNRFIRFKIFDDIKNDTFEDLSYLIEGVPYYLEVINSELFIGEIDNKSCVKILSIIDDNQLKIKKIIK
jgi:hypothetical protein